MPLCRPLPGDRLLPTVAAVATALILLAYSSARRAHAEPAPAFVPHYDHIVLVVMENKNFDQVIGHKDRAPFINALASAGASLTNFHGLAHPSQPNYIALYAGDAFGINDNDEHRVRGTHPTLSSILAAAGKSFLGYYEKDGWQLSHNPWRVFGEMAVERDYKDFPARGHYDQLPTIAFVMPNVTHDMHDGTIKQGDSWLWENLASYAEWAKANNSLLIVAWDESDDFDQSHTLAIFYGAHVIRAAYTQWSGHYDICKTMLATQGLPAPGRAAAASILPIFGENAHAPTDRLPAETARMLAPTPQSPPPAGTPPASGAKSKSRRY